MKEQLKNKINIDIQDIINFCNCPVYYKLNKARNEEDIIFLGSNEHYKNVMLSTMYRYFNNIRNNCEVSTSLLASSFVHQWIGANKSINDILYVKPVTWRDRHNIKRKKALSVFPKVHNYFKKNKSFPILVNFKYELPITKSVTLTGVIDVVREVNGKIQLLKFDTEYKSYNPMQVSKNLEITGAVLAFQRVFNKSIDEIIFFDLDKGVALNTARVEDDYKFLKAVAINSTKAIYNNLYYANPTEKCYRCVYKSTCVDNLNFNMIK